LQEFPPSIRILPHCCDSVTNAKRCRGIVFGVTLILEPHVVADFGLYWFRRGDHGMNQCLRSLACVVAVAALALLPTELAAKSSHKPSASKKTHEAKAGKQRHAAAKSRHGKHAEAKRKPKKQDDEPSDKPAAPPLTGPRRAEGRDRSRAQGQDR
jgi:hypothetical protein